MLRIFKRMRASRSKTDDMHKGHDKPAMEGMPMASRRSMTEGPSMEERSVMHDKPMMDDVPMGGHGRQAHPDTGGAAFTCPACGADFDTRAELEDHGRPAH